MTRAFLSTLAAALLLACSTRAGDSRPIAWEPERSEEVAPRASTQPPIARPPPSDEPPARPSEGVDQLLTAQRALAGHGSTLGEPPDVFQIPAEARPLFADLERAVFRYLKERLAVVLSGPRVDDGELSRALLEPLERRHVARGFDEQAFGSLLGITARRHPGELLGVVVTLSLDCGSDDTLFVFSTETPVLRHVLTVAARARTSISDGQLGLEYALVPSPTGGDPDVVVSSSTPWCASAWRSLRLDVLSPAKDPEKPVRRLTREDSVWIGNRISEISAGSGWFQITYDTWTWLGSGVADPKLQRFRREGGKWKSVAPDIAQPEDLVRTWAGLPAALARELVVPDARREVGRLHAAFASGSDRRNGDLVVERSGPRRARAVFDCDGCASPRGGTVFELHSEGGVWRIAGVKQP